MFAIIFSILFTIPNSSPSAIFPEAQDQQPSKQIQPEHPQKWLATEERKIPATNVEIKSAIASSCPHGPETVFESNHDTVSCTFVKEVSPSSDLKHKLTLRYELNGKELSHGTNVRVSVAICQLDLLGKCTSIPYPYAKGIVDAALDDIEKKLPKKPTTAPVTPPPPPIVKH